MKRTGSGEVPDNVLAALSPHYTLLKKVGAGSHGEVFVAVDKKYKTENRKKFVVLKIIPLFGKEQLKIYNNEAKNLRRLDTSLTTTHVCKMLNSTKVHTKLEGSFAVLSLERMDTDFLSYLMAKGDKLKEAEIKLIFRQVCLGVQHCHQNKIAHLDIKADNVLLKFSKSKAGNSNHSERKKVITDVKLCDFGYARFWGKKSIRRVKRKYKGTKEYRCPELGQRKGKFSLEKADIWSLGILLFTAITGYFPYVVDKDLQYMVDLNVIKTFTTDERCYRLIVSLLQEDYRERPSISEILSDPWFMEKSNDEDDNNNNENQKKENENGPSVKKKSAHHHENGNDLISGNNNNAHNTNLYDSVNILEDIHDNNSNYNAGSE